MEETETLKGTTCPLGNVTVACNSLRAEVKELQKQIDFERDKQREITEMTNQLYEKISALQVQKQTSGDRERDMISQIQRLQDAIMTLESSKKTVIQLDIAPENLRAVGQKLCGGKQSIDNKVCRMEQDSKVCSNEQDSKMCSIELSNKMCSNQQQNIPLNIVNKEERSNDQKWEAAKCVIEDQAVCCDTVAATVEIGCMDGKQEESVLVERVETATPDFQFAKEKVLDEVGSEYRVHRDQPEVMEALEALLQLEQMERVDGECNNINQTISNIVSNECEMSEVHDTDVINTMEIRTTSSFVDSPGQSDYSTTGVSSPCPSQCSDVPATSLHNLLQKRASKSCKSVYLPPCRVCSDPATGFHYGVNSCEACKGFFRRSIVKIQQKNQVYKCKGSPNGVGKCILGPGKRNSCAACRYNKCIASGMAVEAIKTGRYTYEKRTQDTVEVRKLKNQENTDEDMSSEELENLLEVLQEAQLRKCPDPKLYMDKDLVKQRQQKAYDDYKAKTETYGSLAIVSKEEWDSFFNNTGIDLDGRLNFIKSRLEKIEIDLTIMVDFVRSIPEYTKLSVTDQTALIKASHFEFAFIGAHRFINPELRVMVGIMDFHETEVKGIVNQGFTTMLFKMANSLLSLNLTLEEISLIQGIVVTFTDRCTLEEPDKVEKIQNKLLSGLRLIARKNNMSPDKRICKVIDKLVALRNLTEMASEINKEVLTWPMLKEYPLALDVLQG